MKGLKWKCVEHVAGLSGNEDKEVHYDCMMAAEKEIDAMTNLQLLDMLEEVMSNET